MRPKRIMTTSSDDTAKQKKKLKEKNMKAELDRLRLFVKELKSKDEQISINESENKNLESTLNTNPIDIDENLYEVTANDENSPNVVLLTSLSNNYNIKNKTSFFPVTANSTLPEKNNGTNVLNSVEIIETYGPSSHHRTHIDGSKCINCHKILEKFTILETQYETLLKGQETINVQMKETFKKLSENTTEISKTFYEPLDGFPLKSLEDFYNLESETKINERNQLCHHLQSLGGAKLREFLHTSVKHIMTDELVNQFTWLGGIGTEKFSDTKMSTLLYCSKEMPAF
ncbi:uncharacterized protein LOC120356943 isoform X1 [Solenopsis invicta]|uniref:uncharacterized protein LOC120356943 isoform X1 n=1 Tax=Solenopsis invicta TaxID=13686 RepID=UPI00193E8805|nr:uncharacterized protein LOC120356943 isoform X1 [Solenopsis invicta]